MATSQKNTNCESNNQHLPRRLMNNNLLAEIKARNATALIKFSVNDETFEKYMKVPVVMAIMFKILIKS